MAQNVDMGKHPDIGNVHARPGRGADRGKEMGTMVIEFTMEEAHAIADAATGLLERNELVLGTIDREALRTADKKITDDVGAEEFNQQMLKLAETA